MHMKQEQIHRLGPGGKFKGLSQQPEVVATNPAERFEGAKSNSTVVEVQMQGHSTGSKMKPNISLGTAFGGNKCCKLADYVKWPFKRQDEQDCDHLSETSLSCQSMTDCQSTRRQDLYEKEASGNGAKKSVSTFELFEYASRIERAAIISGMLFMLYAASWQPISVFILATMSTLMGHYSHQMSSLEEFKWAIGNASSQPAVAASVLAQSTEFKVNMSEAAAAAVAAAVSASGSPAASPSFWESLLDLGADHQKDQNFAYSENSSKAEYENSMARLSLELSKQEVDSMPILTPIFSLFEPFLFKKPLSETEQPMELAIANLLEVSQRHFLRQSLHINGSAFILAQTQLLSFFIGMSLIVWAAKRQASRLKILYFGSCLRQELAWFQSLNDAAGSGSSLNALVAKYEDGIGVKLALLTYFIGHIILFALVAFCQLLKLAAFCMPFVLLVALVICYLSNRQSRAIGEHSVFAKQSLKLAEEIISSVRTVFAFNGEAKELVRFQLGLEPVYRKSLLKHAYTSLNVALSKFSIFACFAIYCFYARRLFPPFELGGPGARKAVVLAVLRGAEVSIVNIVISIPFMEALQQSKGCIACIYQVIERQSLIRSPLGAKIPTLAGTKPEPNLDEPSLATTRQLEARLSTVESEASGDLDNFNSEVGPSSAMCETVQTNTKQDDAKQIGGSTLIDQLAISFKQVCFQYANRPQILFKESSGGQLLASEMRRPTLSLINTSGTRSERRASELALKQIELAYRRDSTCPPDVGSDQGNWRSKFQNLANHAIGSMAKNHETMEPEEPGLSERILHDFSLDIQAGQSVALVGPSGSGKSTVLSLVQRLYDISSGELLINGSDVRSLPLDWLRDQIGVVSQEPRLFDLTIAENIKLGLSQEQLRLFEHQRATIDQQVIVAARLANAHRFISRLPLGYETRVGAGGLQLSGGQKQRIAIARALIRRPKLLLLDECTSALDTESESQVQLALKAAARGRTCLMVAHRLDSVRHADRIVMMANGRVLESGSHTQLMANKGPYAALYERQTIGQREASGTISDASAPLGDEAGEESDQLGSDLNQAKAEPRSQRMKNHPRNARYQQQANSRRENSKKSSKQSRFGRRYKRQLQFSSSSGSSSEGTFYTSTEEEGDDDNSVGPDRQFGASHSSRKWAQSFNLASGGIQLLKFIEVPYWSAFAAIIACLLAGLILPMNLIAHSYLFRAFAYDEPDRLGAHIHLFGLLMLSFSAFVFIVTFLQVALPGYVGEKLSLRLRAKMMQSLLNKPMFYFEIQSNGAGALCDRFNTHISNIQQMAGIRIATLLESFSCLVAGAIFGLGQNLELSLFCLSFALLVLFTTILESRLMEIETSRERIYDSKLANLMADALSNMKTIASLNGEKFFIEKFAQIIDKRAKGSPKSLVLFRTFLTSLKFIMPAMSWSASMYYGCLLMTKGRIDLQTVFIVCPVVLFAVNDTFRALVFLPELLKARHSVKHLYRMHKEFSPRFLENLSLAEQLKQQSLLVEAGGEAGELKLPANAANSQESPNQSEPEATATSVTSSTAVAVVTQLDRRLSSASQLPTYMRRRKSCLNSLVPQSCVRGRIEFENVEFAYPSRAHQLVLDQFTLSVNPGECVALVGSSGSGKSTCAALLEKFYDFHGGKIMLDGNDLRLVEPHWIRSQIGLVTQEPSLLSYTIAENIRYGDNSRLVSMSEVVEAARTANIHDFIMTLPDQYETLLSGGVAQLSGGQRQRIAIARALIRRAPILIFDEATSALDSHNEALVQAALNKIRRGRTTLIIAHRLSTIRDADKIVVMHEGRLVESGRHHELLAKANGHYKALWERQEAQQY